MTAPLILATVVALQIPTTPVAGSISGVVVNASRDMAPVARAPVVLRVQVDGQFVVAAECNADEQGRFIFENIPADDDYVYLPGANRAGVHYPGSRISLNGQMPHARVKLKVHDPVAEPNPLVLRRHHITIRSETDALRVTETLLIDNPSSHTYVGLPARQGGRAATLYLSIPSDFRRTTFHKEFFGRQFTLIDGRLVTDIPWTPGQRELEFTYVLPNQDRYPVWQRPLDLPCDNLRVTVHSENPDDVDGNLPRAVSRSAGTVTFESTGVLPAGHQIHLRLGSVPVSPASYARWLALAVLFGLIAATGAVGVWYRRRQQPRSGQQPTAEAPKQAA